MSKSVSKPARRIGGKSVITNPASKREMKIDASFHTHFKKAILESLKASKGKTFTDLADDVKKITRKNFSSFKGSVSWYTISVLRDLETKGLVENYIEKGKKYNRLKK